MKWEKIKNDVASALYSTVLEGMGDGGAILVDLLACNFETVQGKGGAGGRVIRQTYADKVYETVMQWDVRMIGKLRALFPGYFPRSLLKGKLTCELTDEGWEVFKTT